MIRGAGEMASGVGHRLVRSHFKVFMTELAEPLCIRREVSFSEAIYDGEATVEGIVAKHVASADQVYMLWEKGTIPVLTDPEGTSKNIMKPHVIVDAILAKRNTGTAKTDAPLVIGLGPGFWAGRDVDVVIETNRGHDLGRIIDDGPASPDTGIPGQIAGASAQRVLRSPRDGIFRPLKKIGDKVESGDLVAMVEGEPMATAISGVIRGLLREGMMVHEGLKAGDVDPRGVRESCFTISDKARAVGGSILEVILVHFNCE